MALAVVALGAYFALRKPAVTDKSIAVLPFANLGADKNDEYLGDGMTIELLNVFAKLPKLKVAARTSSFFFKGKNLPIAEVGKQLSVAYVLEGSVRKTGNKLRITAELINAADGYHVWSESYDKDMTDFLAIQSEVSQQVVKALQVTLGVEESRAFVKRATENPEAHRFYLLGRHYFMQASQVGWKKAFDAFNEAIRLDPDYALPYCGIADTYGWVGTGTLEGRIVFAKQEEMARKALAIAPNLPDAVYSLGVAKANMFQWVEGERELRRALTLDPNLTAALDQLAWLQGCVGRAEEGIALMKRAVKLEELSVFYQTDLAFAYFAARRYDECIAEAKRAIDLDAGFAFAHQVLGWGYYGKQNFSSAVKALRDARDRDNITWYEGRLGYALARAGDAAGAREILRQLEASRDRRYVGPGATLPILIGLGEYERAFEQLPAAVEQQDGICWCMKFDPLWDPLRGDPRFKAVLKQVGLDQ